MFYEADSIRVRFITHHTEQENLLYQIHIDLAKSLSSVITTLSLLIYYLHWVHNPLLLAPFL